MLNRLERIAKKHWLPESMGLDPDEQLSILRERIRSLLPPEAGKSRVILVTSSALSQTELQAQCRKLEESFRSADPGQSGGQPAIPSDSYSPDQPGDQEKPSWRFTAVESVNQSAAMIPLAPQADGCLIYEQQERSLYPQIDRQLVQLKDLGIRILGFVYLYGEP